MTELQHNLNDYLFLISTVQDTEIRRECYEYFVDAHEDKGRTDITQIAMDGIRRNLILLEIIQ